MTTATTLTSNRPLMQAFLITYTATTAITNGEIWVYSGANWNNNSSSFIVKAGAGTPTWGTAASGLATLPAGYYQDWRIRIVIPTVNMAAGETLKVYFAARPTDDSARVADTWYIFTKATSSGAMTEMVGSPVMTAVAPGTAAIDINTAKVGSTSTHTITYTSSAIMDGGGLRVTVPANWTVPSASNVTITPEGGVTLGTTAFTAQQIFIPITTMTSSKIINIAYTGTPNASAAVGANTFLVEPKVKDAYISISSPAVTVNANGTGNSQISLRDTNIVFTTLRDYTYYNSYLYVNSTAGFPSSGTVRIGNEAITYGSITAGVSLNGVLGRTYAYNAGTVVLYVDAGLRGDIDASATAITVYSTSGFASSGNIRIEDETISYTDTTGSTIFTGCTRGVSSTAASHERGAFIYADSINATKGVEGVYTIIYRSAATLSGGQIKFTIPTGWTAPVKGSNFEIVPLAAASVSGVNVSGQDITVDITDMWNNNYINLIYRGTPGSSAVTGVNTFTVQSKGSGGTFASVSASPTVNVSAAAGGGGSAVVVPTTAIINAADIFTVTYTAAAVMTGGEVRLTVPSGWSAAVRPAVLQ